MRPGRRLLRSAAVLPILVTIATAMPVVPAALAAAPRTAAPAQGVVQVRIDDVTPSVVPRSTTRLPLQFRLTLTNTSGAPLNGVRVRATRGVPIGNQQALDAALADTSGRVDGIDIPAARPLLVDLPAAASVTTTFVSTISVLDDGRGLCQCQNSIYPIHLTAAGSGGAVLGSATTFVPSQVEPVTRVKVGWAWPLLDRPHRLGDETIFLDDTLAASVAGGRLDRALQVIERLDPAIPITLVLDPELLDELEVMAGGAYRIRAAASPATSTASPTTSANPAPGATSATTPGTGGPAARAWLDRLAAVLRPDRAVQISLTPYADPDVQSLSADGLTWSTVLPASMLPRVTAALAGRPLRNDVAWPAGGTASRKTLDAMAAAGVGTVVVDGSALSPSTSDQLPVTVARLRALNGSVTAAATSPATQRQIAQAIDSQQIGTIGANALPFLIAEIAVRALQNGTAPDLAVLTPPRYVDPSPDRAVRVIQDTSSGPYMSAVSVRSLSAERPTRFSSARASAPTSAGTGLPAANLDAADAALTGLPAISALLTANPTTAAVIAGIGSATQRISSAAWRPISGSPIDVRAGPALAGELADQVRTLLGGVRIVTPSSGSYTLGSQVSRLPITVENTLPYPVQVQVRVASVGGVPGYTMRSIDTQRIAANGKQTLQVPSQLDRSGRIPVQAQLTTPTGRNLGSPVLLYVRSTVFGTIGIVITLVAGGVLLLALIVRLTRRIQHMRRKAERARRAAARTETAADTVGSAST